MNSIYRSTNIIYLIFVIFKYFIKLNVIFFTFNKDNFIQNSIKLIVYILILFYYLLIIC